MGLKEEVEELMKKLRGIECRNWMKLMQNITKKLSGIEGRIGGIDANLSIPRHQFQFWQKN